MRCLYIAFSLNQAPWLWRDLHIDLWSTMEHIIYLHSQVSGSGSFGCVMMHELGLPLELYSFSTKGFARP